MTHFMLEDCQFDQIAEKIKYHKIWGTYSKHVRVRVKEGTVCITSKKGATQMLSCKNYTFIPHPDACFFIVRGQSSSISYKFPDENVTSQFFNAITPFKGKYSIHLRYTYSLKYFDPTRIRALYRNKWSEPLRPVSGEASTTSPRHLSGDSGFTEAKDVH